MPIMGLIVITELGDKGIALLHSSYQTHHKGWNFTVNGKSLLTSINETDDDIRLVLDGVAKSLHGLVIQKSHEIPWMSCVQLSFRIGKNRNHSWHFWSNLKVTRAIDFFLKFKSPISNLNSHNKIGTYLWKS